MNKEYIIADPWSIIEEGFDTANVEASESIFSLGNGAMGQRANFEEHYSGKTFQGSYVGGVYYPDKTRVGWWKNGYPEYFAKVLNAPNWIGIDVFINGEQLDLASCKKVIDFRRVLNMQEGIYRRSFVATLQNDITINVHITRFLSLRIDELGAIKYEVKPVSGNAEITFKPYLDAGITNEDSNWDDQFWETYKKSIDRNSAFVSSKTMKTDFHVCTFMNTNVQLYGNQIELSKTEEDDLTVTFNYNAEVTQNTTITLTKFGGYISDRNQNKEVLVPKASEIISLANNHGFDELVNTQKEDWQAVWDMADIEIEGDVKAQQAIRFNIFQLNQTYSGKDAGLNIGPKGFTGEKYGGSTYWDTEAYCIPFYMATKNQEVARNLLVYRYKQLNKAIENADKLGFTNGAALYPMVTMNGEECHNEWEITFEEIHRNGAIAFAIYNYNRYTGDFSYIPEMGLEVLIGIARFWHQRANFSTASNKYVILGVTGPNEYENNVNNNWYTNYIAKWCIDYALETIAKVKNKYTDDYHRIKDVTNINDEELIDWQKVADNMFYPFSEEHDVYLQQDGFLDKELITVDQLNNEERPINQFWSWDRILRSPYIKQADVLQGFYFFEDHFTADELRKHFDFYEPFTVHESSLSPCIHSIQAAKLNNIEQAYTFYLRTSRLDLDDYNREVHEGLHITSMAGTWMSIVEGFAGMRVKNDMLSFEPRIPKQWDGYSFKVNFRNQILKVTVEKEQTQFEIQGNQVLQIMVNGKVVTISPNNLTKV